MARARVSDSTGDLRTATPAVSSALELGHHGRKIEGAGKYDFTEFLRN